MTTVGRLALVLTFPLAAYCAFRHDSGIASVRGGLEALREQMEAWQAAHDHQVATLDRRMADVESAAARAEQETRIVSVQITELCDGADERATTLTRLCSGRRVRRPHAQRCPAAVAVRPSDAKDRLVEASSIVAPKPIATPTVRRG